MANLEIDPNESRARAHYLGQLSLKLLKHQFNGVCIC